MICLDSCFGSISVFFPHFFCGGAGWVRVCGPVVAWQLRLMPLPLALMKKLHT